MLWAQIEPFGIEATWLGHAITAATVANTNRDAKKKSEPYTAEDFMPKFDQAEREPKSAAEIYAMIRTWAVLAGGRGKDVNAG